MRTLLTGAKVVTKVGVRKADIGIEDDKVCVVVNGVGLSGFDKVIRCDNFFITPGFVDPHVHLREPGFSYKETIATGTDAALHNGYKTVMTMPNLDPAPYNMENLKVQMDIIERDAKVQVIPYGRITSDGKTLADMEAMAPYVCGFSDDGKGVQDEEVMRAAMLKAKELDKIIVAHCEDERWNTYEPESEWKQIERDLRLAKETGCKYHVCHISCAKSVYLIRQAKFDGVDVTCETAPHYLVFNNENLPDEGRFKMNPPIRTEQDRKALIYGLRDGTIDMIATDHAPHSAEEKSRGFKDSLFGIVGLETAFQVLLTNVIKDDDALFEKIVNAMTINPAKRFGVDGAFLKPWLPADLYFFNMKEKYTIDSKDFRSMGKSSPFDGMEVRGKLEKVMRKGQFIDLSEF